MYKFIYFVLVNWYQHESEVDAIPLFPLWYDFPKAVEIAIKRRLRENNI